MKTPNQLLTAGLAALLATSTVACGSTSGGSGAAGGGTFPIGVVLDRTGVLASASAPVMNGIQLAVDDVNGSGGIDGRKIELIVEDSASDPAVAAAAARTLRNKAQVVIGSATGAGCRAMQPILADAEVLHYCQSPQPFELKPQFFWGLAPTRDYPAATLPWLRSTGVHTIGFVGQDDASGDGYLQLVKSVVEANPGEFRLVGQERFGSGATNLETQLTHIRDANPDLVVAGTSGGNIVPVVRAMNALGMRQPLYVGTGSASLDSLAPVAGDLPAGGIYANAFWVDVAGEVPDTVSYAGQVRTFATAYSAKYGAPAASSAGAYDSVMQVIAAFRSGATTGKQLASYLETNPYTGVLGPYALSPQRHQGASLPSIMMTYQNGSFRLAFAGPA